MLLALSSRQFVQGKRRPWGFRPSFSLRGVWCLLFLCCLFSRARYPHRFGETTARQPTRLHAVIPTLCLRTQRLNRLRLKPLVYFTANDDPAALTQAVLYVLRNEIRRWVKFVRVYPTIQDVPVIKPAVYDHINREFPSGPLRGWEAVSCLSLCVCVRAGVRVHVCMRACVHVCVCLNAIVQIK